MFRWPVGRGAKLKAVCKFKNKCSAKTLGQIGTQTVVPKQTKGLLLLFLIITHLNATRVE
jgi:hypothetical protein